MTSLATIFLHGSTGVCTIYSYKGLKSAVVILTELHALRPEIANQLLYVGLSRARHHAVMIGELPAALDSSKQQ